MTGAVRADSSDRTLAAPWPGPAGAVTLTGTLAGGGTVTALDGAGGRPRLTGRYHRMRTFSAQPNRPSTAIRRPPSSRTVPA